MAPRHRPWRSPRISCSASCSACSSRPTEMEEPRRPIADYGLIGDTRVAALVSSDGAIDWMCVPHFDGEPLFGRLVGGARAGTYRVGPTTPTSPATRRYRPNTATLETTWTL